MPSEKGAAASSFVPPVRRRLSDQITQQLEQLITEGEYAPGDRLPSERELMDHFGVGRPSIRESLFALERKGLVRLSRGERPQVVQPDPARLFEELSGIASGLVASPQGVAHFNQLRLLYETSLARHAAETASEDEIARLERALERNEAEIGRRTRFARTDVEFHRVLAQMPRNPILRAVHDALVEWVISRRVLKGDVREQNQRSFAGHVAIFEAIRMGDAAAADQAMREHLTRANSEYE